MTIRRRILTALLAVYTVFVLAVTLSPRMPSTGRFERLVVEVIASLHARGLLVGVEYDHVEFTANIGMFVPLGVLAALLLPRRARWVLLIAGTAFSVFIELYQYLLLPGRVGDWRDVVSNSTGFLIGAAIALLLAKRNNLSRRAGTA